MFTVPAISLYAKSTPTSIPLQQSSPFMHVLYQQDVRSISTAKASMQRAHVFV
jgi:hypothetical protein